MGTVDLENTHTSGLYAKRDLVIVDGQGAILRDEHGKEYIDCVGGQGTANLGHALSFMEKSELMVETLGPHIFDSFLFIKNAEWAEYRTQVTGWELDKYLPIL